MAYVAQGPQRIMADLRDQTLGSFSSVALITPTLVSSALAPYALTAARVLATAYAAITIGLITFFVGMIAAFTLASLARGTFLPKPAPAPASAG